jgi:Fe-S-cluster containining protein
LQAVSLPPLYQRWMSQFLPAGIPDESKATCDHCAMQAPEGGPVDERAIYFNQGKCCTYLPQMHCFLVGRVLLDDSPEQARGRAVLEALLDARAGVSPLGVLGPPSYQLLYQSAPAGFGRSRDLLCPFFETETGRCRVWAHRESTCATWFCKHDRGAVGFAFWRALHHALATVERALASWCALELDLGAEALAENAPRPGAAARSLEAEEVDGKVSDAAYRKRWGNWLSRERDYYRSAARMVEPLSWQETLVHAGADGRVAARLLREAHAALLDFTPPLTPLRLGRFERLRVKDGAAQVQTYRDYDPLELPQALLSTLRRFDGRPNAEVVREIAERDGVRLTPEVIRRLADFELLVRK